MPSLSSQTPQIEYSHELDVNEINIVLALIVAR